MITELKENQVFVFGSNEAGIHGAGAAKTALEKFGARMYQGFGHFGQSFAIPTKDKEIRTLPLSSIQPMSISSSTMLNFILNLSFF